MKSEEKLSRLFETLKTEKPLTTLADVNGWIQVGIPTIETKKAKKITIKKVMIMSTIAAVSVAGMMAIFSSVHEGRQEKYPFENKNHVVDTSQQQKDRPEVVKGREITGEPSRFGSAIQQTNSMNINSADKALESKNSSAVEEENVKMESKAAHMHYERKFASGKGENRGIWRSVNDTLKVDTLFKNVKVLVFSGDFNDQILIKGSKRSDLSLDYTYERKTKGLIISGREHPIELSYELNDTILTIQLDRKVKVTVSFFSVTNEKNKLEFDVPENLEVQLKTEYGNIEAYGLRNKTNLHTSYGDFIAQDLSGEVKLDTDYGDILLKNSSGLLKASSDYGDINSQEISGDIELKTIYGDIMMNKSKGMLNIVTENGDVFGKSMLVEEWASVKSGYGEIDLQIVNPISDFKIDLSTKFGKTKVDRADMELQSESRLKTGSGSLKLNAESDFGDVIIR